MGGAFQSLANASWAADDPENAKQMFELAARKFEDSGHLFNVAAMKQNTGVMFQTMGELEAALEAFEETARSHERMGALISLGVAKCNIASVLLYLGQYRKCLSFLDESEPFFARLKTPALAALASMTKASCLVRMGETEKALPLLRKGWKTRKRAGRWSDMGQYVEVLIQAAAVTGDTAEALNESKAFLGEAKKKGAKKAYRQALELRLEALLLTKKNVEAEKIAGLIEEVNTSRRNNYSRALTLALLARFAAIKGDAGQAKDFLNEAFSTGRLNVESRAAANFHVGRALLKEGRPAEAKQFLEKAKDEYSILTAAGYRKHEFVKCNELLKEFRT
jgi:tetratricopeptide (TPR) repeat protein